MSSVERSADGFVIDAALIGEAFDIAPADVQALMRQGAITSVCETGQDEDEGRLRMTFHYGGRTCRYIFDASGTILKSASFSGRARGQGK